MTLALPDVLGTKVGRLVATEFADPARLAALGASRFIRFGIARGLQIRRPVADRLVQTAKDALPTADAPVARAVLAADLTLLGDLDAQIEHATAQLCRLVPASPFAPLLTVPGWAAVRAGNYGGGPRRPEPHSSQLRPAVPGWRARRTRTRRRPRYGRQPQGVMPPLAWRPGPSPSGTRTKPEEPPVTVRSHTSLTRT